MSNSRAGGIDYVTVSNRLRQVEVARRQKPKFERATKETLKYLGRKKEGCDAFRDIDQTEGYRITYKNTRQFLPLEFSRTLSRLVNFQPEISSFTERTLVPFFSWACNNAASLPKDLGSR